MFVTEQSLRSVSYNKMKTHLHFLFLHICCHCLPAIKRFIGFQLLNVINFNVSGFSAFSVIAMLFSTYLQLLYLKTGWRTMYFTTPPQGTDALKCKHIQKDGICTDCGKDTVSVVWTHTNIELNVLSEHGHVFKHVPLSQYIWNKIG